MGEQSSIAQDFKALCQQYGLPEDENQTALLGVYLSGEGMMPASPYLKQDVFGLARMLKQLSFARKRGFSLLVGGIKEDYDAEQVEVLKKPLEDALREKVVKYKETWVNPASLGIKGVPKDKMLNLERASLAIILPFAGGEMERRIWLYPEGVNPSEQGFSREELDAILDFEKRVKVVVEKLQGNKERWENEGRSRLPELGSLAVLIKSYLPGEWEVRKQLTFIADFLFGAGFLDFKGELWKEAFKGKNPAEKDRLVRNWIASYQKVQSTK